MVASPTNPRAPGTVVTVKGAPLLEKDQLLLRNERAYPRRSCGVIGVSTSASGSTARRVVRPSSADGCSAACAASRVGKTLHRPRRQRTGNAHVAMMDQRPQGDSDVPPIRFGPGVIKDGDGRCAGPVNVAQIHHKVADNASPGVEEMQLRLAPVQQPRRGGIVKIWAVETTTEMTGSVADTGVMRVTPASAVARSTPMLLPSAVPDLVGRVDRPLSWPLLRLSSPCGADLFGPPWRVAQVCRPRPHHAAGRPAVQHDSRPAPNLG